MQVINPSHNIFRPDFVRVFARKPKKVLIALHLILDDFVPPFGVWLGRRGSPAAEVTVHILFVILNQAHPRN